MSLLNFISWHCLKATLIDVFYGNEDESGMHNVDIMTDISSPATAFTRYTVAPSSVSRSSRYGSSGNSS